MFEKNYIEACLAGEALLGYIHDYIEYWHTHETGTELYEFLGMTAYEYSQWLRFGRDIVLRDIMEAHNEGISYEEYQSMPEEKRIAARSRRKETIDQIKRAPEG